MHTVDWSFSKVVICQTSLAVIKVQVKEALARPSYKYTQLVTTHLDDCYSYFNDHALAAI